MSKNIIIHYSHTFNEQMPNFTMFNQSPDDGSYDNQSWYISSIFCFTDSNDILHSLTQTRTAKETIVCP